MGTDTFRIAVVDDEPFMVDFLEQTITKLGYSVQQFSDGASVLAYLKNEEIDLLITDFKMPGMSGIELLEKVKVSKPGLGVIIMTAFGTIESAVKALKLGATDYITKPFSIDDIRQTIENYFESQEQRHANMTVRGEDRFGELVGKSKQMQKVYKTISLVANSRASVFVQGPSGTGKELVARAIHYNSDRRDNAYIRINCAALPEGLMESELFGHEKGAFTGAIRKNVGKFEIADSGTLLLDEITEMDIGLQAKLLRAIQEKEFQRVGGTETISVDVRIIATSNRDLLEAVENGQLREDLYYRLNTIPIHLPPLADRREDIRPLVEHFIEKFCNEYGSAVLGIEEAALNRLVREQFPGNVRELENLILRAIILCQSETLSEDVLFPEGNGEHVEIGSVITFESPVSIEEMERDLILQTLEFHEYSRTKSAESLGINVRTLRNKLNLYKDQGHITDGFFND